MTKILNDYLYNEILENEGIVTADYVFNNIHIPFHQNMSKSVLKGLLSYKLLILLKNNLIEKMYYKNVYVLAIRFRKDCINKIKQSDILNLSIKNYSNIMNNIAYIKNLNNSLNNIHYDYAENIQTLSTSLLKMQYSKKYTNLMINSEINNHFLLTFKKLNQVLL